MNVDVMFSDDARKKIEQGVNLVAKAVATTLGPKGRNFVSIDLDGRVVVSKDGVSCAKAIESVEDQFVNVGIQLCKQVSMKTNEIAGDGTTTATVLAQAIVKEGLRYVAAGGSPLALKRGIDKALDVALEKIEEQSLEVTDRQQIEYVAAISGNEKEVGVVVADAIEAVGSEGIITLEESRERETYFQLVDGFSYNQGYISPYLISDVAKSSIDYKDVIILMFDCQINQFESIIPALEKAGRAKKPILIIAEGFSKNAIDGLIINKTRGLLQWAATKTPGFGEQKKEYIQDIAAKVGGIVFNENIGHKFDEITEEFFGFAKRVVITKDYTTIIEGKTNQKALQERIELLKNLIETEESDYNREKMNERLGKLNDGVGMIKIGASTETELKEKKYRYEDALNATRAAIDEGIVPGGGICLMRLSGDVEKSTQVDDLDEDEAKGVKILAQAMKAPFKQICENGGYPTDALEYEIMKEEDFQVGFDAKYNKVCDLYEAGVIDPAKVTKTALTNAVSIASLVLTTETLIVPIIDKEKVLVAEGMY